MNSLGYVFLSVTVALTAVGQLAQKLATRSFSDVDGVLPCIRAMVRSRPFWLAAVCLGLAMLTWLLSLAVFEVSRAYPLLSSSFVVTALMSRWFLHERISLYRWLGIGLISCGAAIMLVA